MDAHDAILEQLQRAQKRGLEAVTNRLDFVLESLDELIKEARSSVQEALPQEAEELFPLAEVEATLASHRARTTELETALEQLEARNAELEAELAEASERAGGPATGELLRRLDAARSQSELLRELLPLLTEHAARAAVLVIRGGEISAWSGIGFAGGEALRRWRAEVGASPVFARFAGEGLPLAFNPAADLLLEGWMANEPVAEEAVLIPVCLRGKVVGAIYLDRLPDRPWDPEAAQGLVAIASWLIDTLGYRQTVPSPALAGFLPADEGPQAPPEEETADGGLESLPEVEPEAEADEVGGELEEEVEVEPAPELAESRAEPQPSEPEAGEAAEEEFDPSATVRIDPSQVPPPPVTMEAAVATAEATLEVTEEPEEEFHEPELVAAAPAPDESDPQHEEARRFARLLVSEVKLYNEEEVERGRVSRDLYQRLKDDIDRSREMYEKRIAPEIREARDYFSEELVRILADGDPDALGM